MNVVKIIKDEDGEKIKNAKWCYIFVASGGNTAFCSGQFFGIGESNCKYAIREGKITCPECIKLIKEIKDVKL